MTKWQHFQKRSFDFLFSFLGLLVLGWLILLAWLIASIETKQNGFFLQRRIGRYGRIFKVVKIRTMLNTGQQENSTVTTARDPRITSSGRIMRKAKIDELPQLLNVLMGQMSLVGPRPDVPGFADKLKGDDRLFLSVRPGITGPASIKYRNEEELLANVDDPISYNRDIIFPDKVKVNLEYIRSWSIGRDLYYIWHTFVG